MREILFRGKRVDNGEWVEGYYLKANNHWHKKGIHEDWIATFTIQNGGWCNVAGKHAVIPETVGQYTGLTDKNGTKIFEGDIVLYRPKDEVGEIRYCELEAMFVIEFDDWLTDFDCVYQNEVEVIGNIHDNPKLLERGCGNG